MTKPESFSGLCEEAYCYNLGTDRPLDVGFVVFLDGKPFGWMRTLEPASKFTPGVIAVSLSDEECDYVAAGGNEKQGAEIWDYIK